MPSEQNQQISDEELDILQEIMNIAFGKAAADLAEVINIYVLLTVPYIKLVPAVELPGYIKSEITTHDRISVVEQNFLGDFKGSAFLIFPSGAGKELISLLGDGEEVELDASNASDLLEKETLVEVGNILIGACVGKVAEMLGDTVTYAPPSVVIENHANEALPASLFDPHSTAIVLRTVFNFNEKNVQGFLFLVTSLESIEWLQAALAKFLEQYE